MCPVITNTPRHGSSSPPRVVLECAARRLPSSFLELFPNTRPSDLVAVIPDSTLCFLSLNSTKRALINDRVAIVYSTKHLVSSSPGDSSFPPLAFFSPCLYNALSLTASVVIRPCLHPIPSLKSVTLSVFLPPFLPTEYAKRIANLSKVALLNRDAHVHDILPVSESVWLTVVAVNPPDVPALVTKSTNVSVTISHQKIPRKIHVPDIFRDWTRRKWRPVEQFISSKDLKRINTALDALPTLMLITGPLRDISTTLVHALHARPVLNVHYPNGPTLLTVVARAELYISSVCSPVIITLPNISPAFLPTLLSVLARQTHPRAHLGASSEGTITFVLSASHVDDVDVRLQRHVGASVSIAVPDDSARTELLERANVSPSDDEFRALLGLTAGLARRDVFALGHLYCRSGMSMCQEAMRRFGDKGVSIDTGGATWQDVGGLEQAKQQIKDLIDVRKGLRMGNKSRRVGVLLYGPPGTGKTLLARAVAGESSCSFMSVKGPELLDMYVGESERNVREVFERASSSAPTVVFFDEVDALAPRRGSAADSGRVADRVVSQLLAEMDDIVLRGDVFVIAATNRPDLVDEALLRPGRLDKLIYVGMPGSRSEQAMILQAQTRKFQMSPNVDLSAVLARAPKPPLLSGADLYALATRAWMHAARRIIETEGNYESMKKQSSLEDGAAQRLLNFLNESDSLVKGYQNWFSTGKEAGFIESCSNGTVEDASSVVVVTHEDFESAANELKPSLTESQLDEYEQLRMHLESNG